MTRWSGLSISIWSGGSDPFRRLKDHPPEDSNIEALALRHGYDTRCRIRHCRQPGEVSVISHPPNGELARSDVQPALGVTWQLQHQQIVRDERRGIAQVIVALDR